MPRWRLRDPYLYPIHFAETLIRAAIDGSAWLGIVPTRRAALALAEEFCCFRYCLRNWPSARGHRAYSAENDHAVRARTVPHENKFAVIISAKPLVTDSIAALNPDLAAEIL